ncbi:uncharacterized protein [Arachis hypogaea]|uniref:uncharacterized protein n=1 Tax=Arachis hypogaea TaxID=3818 RepID=UPI000DECD561|nr:uncharacterized protein LOC112757581 [Arachis hypogaea]
MFKSEIQRAQRDEQKLQQLFQPVGDKWHEEFTKDDEGLWRYKARICIPDVGSLRQDLLSEAYNSGFSIHPGSTKMYYDLKKMFWWPGMKGDVATTDGQSERTIQMLEDLLRACVLDQPGSWDRYMPLVEFAYNNNVVAETTEKIKRIRERILTAQSRQKSYADQRREPLEFEIGEHVFLKVTLTTGIGREIKTKKLNPRYIGPFEILKRFGPVAYQYTPNAAHVLEPESVELKENLIFQVTLVRIDDTSVKKLRGKDVPLVKVAWERARVEEHTWELESEMRKDYPKLFSGEALKWTISLLWRDID